MGLGDEFYLRRWMMFVDGENLTIRAQEFCQQNSITLQEGDYYRRDNFVWFPNRWTPTENPHMRNLDYELQPRGIRAYYYASVQGDDVRLREVREQLWRIGFTPEVFKNPAGERRSKGVDITLAKDVLS